MPESKALHFIVSGRVQGVGFRYAARRKAAQLGLSGWVANRPNGEVEALAHGEAARVDQFQAWLRVGPQHARVDRVEAAPAAAEPVEAPGDFQIRV